MESEGASFKHRGLRLNRRALSTGSAILFLTSQNPRRESHREVQHAPRAIHPIESEKQAEEMRRWMEGERARGKAGGGVAPV